MDAFIPRGELSVDIYARQGIRKSEELEATGKPWQRFHLSGVSIAQATIRVLIDDDIWSEVRHFQESDGGSLHFMADTDALDITSILFGDGQAGAVPATGKNISVSWLESFGAKGNIGPGRITQLLSAVYHDGAQIPS